MKIIKWIDKNLEEFLISVILCSLILIMTIQIFMRFTMNASLSWPEEVSQYLFVWAAFIGVSYITKIDSHLRIDMILSYFGSKAQLFFSIFRDASFVFFAILMIIGGVYVYNNMSVTMQKSVALNIPYKFIYLSLPFGFALSLFRIIQKYVLKVILRSS